MTVDRIFKNDNDLWTVVFIKTCGVPIEILAEVETQEEALLLQLMINGGVYNA